jgi:molecular chaperone DnaK (HSP70)
LVVPAYLTRDQVQHVIAVGQSFQIPILGVLSRCMAAGMQSYLDSPWHHLSVVVDVDDHALTCSVIRAVDLEMVLLASRSESGLGLRHWKEKLLARIADLSVRTNRRDPRESPEADQMLFGQLDAVLSASSQNRPATIQLKALGWHQNLAVPAAESARACQVLAQRAGHLVQEQLRLAESHLGLGSVFLTAGAARLPGLIAAIYQGCESKVPVSCLPPQASAWGAHDLACRIETGEVAPWHFERTVPLPPLAAEVPPTLPFQSTRRQIVSESY